MSNGCNYWMVYLPDFSEHTFLLFVTDAQERTSLRDYSQGWAHKLTSAPSFQEAMRRTEEGRTRFALHEVRRKEDTSFWQAITLEHNRRFLGLAASGNIATTKTEKPSPNSQRYARKATGRAARGSQRQLQDYVNLFPQELNRAVLAQLPEVLRDRSIRWLSPLADEDYREYQDNEFLEILGLGSFCKLLADFWPKGGPCWDSLGMIEARNGNEVPIALLVEAKSHIPEMRSQGCQASESSFGKIRKTLDEANNWCGAAPEADWTGPLYQSANRIAYLYFLRHKLSRPCYLINLYFVDDPYRPTSQAEWTQALEAAHRELGLKSPVRGLVEVFLAGKEPIHATLIPSEEEHPRISNESRSASIRVEVLSPDPSDSTPSLTQSAHDSFSAWRDRWQHLASFDGAHLPNPESRIKQVLALWQESIPGKWERERGWDKEKWKASPYRRGDLESPHAGEHTMEREILIDRREKVTLLGEPLLYGINAVPLVCDFSDHGRRANVETDLLLLSCNGAGYRLALCEVKATADHPWFAAVELLRQMRLFLSSHSAQSLMTELGHLPVETANVTMTGLVVAPNDYYSAQGKKANAVAPARMLLSRMRQRYNVDVRLAVWDTEGNSIEEYLGA